jgi:hypothetical protein
LRNGKNKEKGLRIKTLKSEKRIEEKEDLI